VHHFTGYALTLAATMRVPVRIAHSHNDTRANDRTPSLLRRFYLSGTEALIRHFATKRIAVSKYAAQSLFPGLSESDEGWRLCPLGIDLSPFALEVDRAEVRTGLGIQQEAFVVGHTGRFVDQKNHRFFVDIAEDVIKLEPNAIFLLVGDGPLKAGIEALVCERGLSKHFIFAGIRSDVPSLLKGAMDCFLFPSIYEGLPLALLEAEAAGLRCFVSDSVSDEGDMSEEVVNRLSLTLSPGIWAARLLQARSQPHRLPMPDAWIEARSIEASAARIESLYRSQGDTHQA
jgi:glycosyltransferase involved in cell wall biosynthesis